MQEPGCRPAARPFLRAHPDDAAAMPDILIPRLWRHITENNPDVLLALQQDGCLVRYFGEKARLAASLCGRMRAEMKPARIIEERCMEVLTGDLRPSRHNYLKAVLEGEFGGHYQRLRQNGNLTGEIICLVGFCRPVFREMGFSRETEHDPRLRQAIAGRILMYLELVY